MRLLFGGLGIRTVLALWKALVRLLRYLGWGVLLVPVALLGVGIFGVTGWTIAAVVVAAVTALALPALAAGLMPLGLVGMVFAAGTSAGRYGGAAAAKTQAVSGFSWVKTGAGVVVMPVKGAAASPQAISVAPGTALKQAVAAASGAAGNQAVAPASAPGAALKQAVAAASGTAGNQAVTAVPAKGFPPKFPPGTVVQVMRAGPVFGPDRVLVPLIVLTLAFLLWMAPSFLRKYADRSPRIAGYLDWRGQQSNWGVLLPVVAALAIEIAGANPLTVTAAVLALIVAARLPRVAADIVPFALAGLAIYGIALAAMWRPGLVGPRVILKAVPGSGYGLVPVTGLSSRDVPWYGLVPVSDRPLALAAGAEGVAFLAFALWLFPRTLWTHVRTAGGDAVALKGRVQRLIETRTVAVDTAAAELRRVERDLHDGAQARLVTIGMNLRAAERLIEISPGAARTLVAEARHTSSRALAELRDLVRGIYPPVLADRGLGDAVRALALDTPMRTELDIDLPGRLEAPVESACYFAVAEILANAVKHSSARTVHIRMEHAGASTGGMLRIEVSDDGTGGADPTRGTGLQGVERRLAAFDGILALSSPAGGPTMVVMEVPCALAAQKAPR
jgi:signal transduction histidine kinase